MLNLFTGILDTNAPVSTTRVKLHSEPWFMGGIQSGIKKISKDQSSSQNSMNVKGYKMRLEE